MKCHKYTVVNLKRFKIIVYYSQLTIEWSSDYTVVQAVFLAKIFEFKLFNL